MRLLFTCMGTSDPVRGYHDGPMLHIIRHYRPEVICVFLSGEAAALDGCGARLDTVLSHIQNNWGGYAPELRVVRTQIDDPSDMDAVGAPITEAVAALTAEFPDRAVPVTVSLGELGGTDGTPVFVPADENYYKVWVDVSAQVMRTDVYRVDRRTGIRELWNSTYATEEVQAVPEAVPVET